jgi:hypothetical protein
MPPGHDPNSAVFNFRTTVGGDAGMAQPGGDPLAERPQGIGQGAGIAEVAVEGGFGRDALQRGVRLDPAVVLAARKAGKAVADGAVAPDQVALGLFLQLADGGDAVLRQRRPGRADARSD